jgi:DNA polymerase III delta subunit
VKLSPGWRFIFSVIAASFPPEIFEKRHSAMMIKGNMLEGFLGNPPAGLRGILLYGPNEGRVREFARMAAKSIVPDLDDPFRVCHLTAADLKTDPARLADEAAAIAMTGGRRVVRVTGIGETQTDIFVSQMDNSSGDAFIIAEAGELTRASRLRKLFESSKLFAIMACYEENAADLDRLVIDHLREHGMRITSEAKAYLLQCLGDDRLAVRQELDKLVLYKWPQPRDCAVAAAGDNYVLDGKKVSDIKDGQGGRDISGIPDGSAIMGSADIMGGLAIRDTPDIVDIHDIAAIIDTGDISDGRDVTDINDPQDVGDISEGREVTDIQDIGDIRDGIAIGDIRDIRDSAAEDGMLVTLQDVSACIGDSSVQGLDGICDAMGEGNLQALDSAMARAYEAALNPVTILRTTSNHLMRLQLAAAKLSEGVSIDMALRSLRPPVNFQRMKSFQLQIRLWNLSRLSRALDLLLAGEVACKSTGAPDLSLCRQAIMQAALLVRRNI